MWVSYKRDALLVNLSVSTLVNKFTDGLEVGGTIGDPWLDNPQHLSGGLGDADKDAIVDLDKTEQLKDFAGLGCDLVDTLYTYNEDQLGLSRDVERSLFLGLTGEADLFTLGVAVLLHILLGALENDFTLLLLGLSTRGQQSSDRETQVETPISSAD